MRAHYKMVLVNIPNIHAFALDLNFEEKRRIREGSEIKKLKRKMVLISLQLCYTSSFKL